MRVEIDQSGKIEDTAKDTVIACANSEKRAVLIPKRVKRQTQEMFRRSGLMRMFVYELFAVGIFFLIRSFRRPQQLTIDIEYPGKDLIIASMVHELLVSHDKPLHELYFARVGNHPAAHYAAKDVFDGKKEADHTLTFEEILRVIRATKKDRWAFKSVSFNAGRRSASVYKRSLSQRSVKVKNKKSV